MGRAKKYSEAQRAGIACLLLSLILNAALFIQWIGSRSPESAAAIDALETGTPPPQRSPMPPLDTGDTDADSVAGLVSAGLTAAEGRNLAVNRINERYRQQRETLLKITDPWLTMDEIYAEGQRRYAKLDEAEQARREALEDLTKQSWAEVDLDFGWGKHCHFFLFSAMLAGQEKADIPALNSLVVQAVREVRFAKKDPFSIVRESHSQALEEIILKQEARLRELLSDDEFERFFEPHISMTFEDVWSMEQRFGRELSEEESDRILALLKPQHPLNEVVGESAVPTRNFPEATLPQIRELVGDASFSQLLKFQDDGDLDWEPQRHLQIYQIEQQFKADCLAGGASPQSPPQEIFDRHTEAVSAALGDQFSAYLASGRGRWLNPEIPHE